MNSEELQTTLAAVAATALATQRCTGSEALTRAAIEAVWRQAAFASSDAPPPAALDHHVEDPAVASSDTRPSTPVEGFHDQLKELGALAEWENRTPHEQGVVLNTAIELDAERTKGVDRCATGGDDPDGGGNDSNADQATNQSSQVNR